MKKLWTGILIFLVLAAAGILIFFAVNRSAVLGTIQVSADTPKSSRSEVTFMGQEGTAIKLRCSSAIKEGSAQIQLADSEGTVIETYEAGDPLSEVITLEKGGTYSLAVTYEDFVGKLRADIRKNR